MLFVKTFVITDYGDQSTGDSSGDPCSPNPCEYNGQLCPNVYDATKYISCNADLSCNIMQCPAGLVWNPNGYCDWP